MNTNTNTVQNSSKLFTATVTPRAINAGLETKNGKKALGFIAEVVSGKRASMEYIEAQGAALAAVDRSLKSGRPVTLKLARKGPFVTVVGFPKTAAANDNADVAQQAA